MSIATPAAGGTTAGTVPGNNTAGQTQQALSQSSSNFTQQLQQLEQEYQQVTEQQQELSLVTTALQSQLKAAEDKPQV
jgi:hypothetical protein